MGLRVVPHRDRVCEWGLGLYHIGIRSASGVIGLELHNIGIRSVSRVRRWG